MRNDLFNFFTNKQKKLAFNMKPAELRRGYKKSEQKLKKVAKTGDERALAEVMKEHGNYEYAMLFQKTPNFKKEKRA